MSATLSERILSRAAGRSVRAGDLCVVQVDMVMIHDSIAPTALRIMRDQLGREAPFDVKRVALAIDHVSPASTVGIAEQQRQLRTWAREQGLPHFFEAGRGIAHQLLIEERLARPGLVVLGSDSHSTAYGAVGAFGTGMGATDIALALASGRTWMRVPETIRVQIHGRFREGVGAKDLALHLVGSLGADGASYRALEYHGMEFMSVGERTTLATMALEAGAKVGIVHPAGLPAEYGPVSEDLLDDSPAHYERVVQVDLDGLEPCVARPGAVDDVVDLATAGEIAVDVVYVGTCTNGRHEDMRRVAQVLDGRPIASTTRLVIVPASSASLQAAVADGTLASLLASGATIGPPGCGACIGRHMGVLAPDEVCLFTGNRNFRGRMGSPDARIYLGSPEVAAATALTGHLSDPRNHLQSLEVRV